MASGCRCRKILKSRLWKSEAGKAWDKSVVDIQGEVRRERGGTARHDADVVM